MRSKLYLSCILLLSATSAASVEAARAAFEVTAGKEYYEYAPRTIDNTFALANVRQKKIGTRKAPFYYNPRTIETDNRLYRVHVPLKITSSRHDLTQTATIVYRFSYTSQVVQIAENKKWLKEVIHTGPFKTERIPLSKGITEWTISSEWQVKCDRDLWDPSSAYLIENYQGQRSLTRTRRSKDLHYSSVAEYYFPFRLIYWEYQDGFREHWPETRFPRLVLRNVEGNEIYADYTFELFTGNSTHGSAGTVKLNGLRTVSKELLSDWENPYRTKNSYSNTWERKPWSATIRKLGKPSLTAAFLARIIKQRPEDIDAYDLLLENLAQAHDSGKASRIYLKCIARWPQYRERWFKKYLASIQIEEVRRAALIAYIRDNPRSGYAHEELIKSLTKAQRWGTAKRLLSTWERLEPSNANVYVSAAVIAEAEERENEEREALQRTIVFSLASKRANTKVYKEGSPAHTWYLRGRNLHLANNPTLAQARLRRALSYDPEYFPAYVTMGDSYLSQGIKASAKGYYEKALNIISNHPAALAGMAQVYENIGRKRTAGRYRERVWQSLKPLAEHEVSAGNWTNAAEITRYILDTAGIIPEAVMLHATAMLKLEMYEKASSILYSLPEEVQNRSEIRMMWADFCRTLQDDTHCVIIADRPLKWQEKSKAAWKDVLKANPINNRARLELLLFALENEDFEQAYLYMKDLYERIQTPELSDWLGSLCLRAAKENPYRTLPFKSDKSFIDESRDFYQRTSESMRQDSDKSHQLLEAHSLLYSPGTYIGLAEAAIQDPVKSGNPLSIIRQGLRCFPGSPELKGALIQQYVSADVTAPKLWNEHTNLFTILRPLDYGIHSAMAEIYAKRKMYAPMATSLIRTCLSEIYWAEALYPDVTTQEELSRPYRVYSVEQETGYRFKLVNHVFLDPVSAYNWYAFRARYTEYDLRHGLTRWWHKRQMLVTAFDNLSRAAAAAPSGITAKLLSILGQKYGSFQLRKRSRAEAFYARQLRNYFYQSITAKRATFAKFPPPNRRDTNTYSIAPLTESLDDIPMPAVLHSRQSLPPHVQHRYVPPALAQALLPEYEWSRVIPAWTRIDSAPSFVSSFSWPTYSTQLISWTEAPDRTFSSRVTHNQFLLYQRQTITDTTMWKRAGCIPQTAERHIPVFPSFFTKALSGSIEDVKVQDAKFNPKRLPELSLVISTSPMTIPSEEWYDEALTLRFTWQNASNCQVRVYSKRYITDEAMQPNTPGKLIGTYPMKDVTELHWKINRTDISLGDDATNLTHHFIHGLSPFAWVQGCSLGIQSCAGPTPVGYSFSEIRIQ